MKFYGFGSAAYLNRAMPELLPVEAEKGTEKVNKIQ